MPEPGGIAGQDRDGVPRPAPIEALDVAVAEQRLRLHDEAEIAEVGQILIGADAAARGKAAITAEQENSQLPGVALTAGHVALPQALPPTAVAAAGRPCSSTGAGRARIAQQSYRRPVRRDLLGDECRRRGYGRATRCGTAAQPVVHRARCESARDAEPTPAPEDWSARRGWRASCHLRAGSNGASTG